MTKYLILAALATLLPGCASKPKTYVCFNPLNVLQSALVKTDSPQVLDKGNRLELTVEDGMVIVPKSLCVEIRE